MLFLIIQNLQKPWVIDSHFIQCFSLFLTVFSCYITIILTSMLFFRSCTMLITLLFIAFALCILRLFIKLIFFIPLLIITGIFLLLFFVIPMIFSLCLVATVCTFTSLIALSLLI